MSANSQNSTGQEEKRVISNKHMSQILYVDFIILKSLGIEIIHFNMFISTCIILYVNNFQQ